MIKRRLSQAGIAALSLIVCVLCVPVSGNRALATPSEESAERTQKIIAKLTAQADRWDKAIIKKDRAAIEANMADDFRHIDGGGNVDTKASFIKGVMAADLVIDPYVVEDFDVRIYGDVALLSGTTRMTGRSEGVLFKSHYRYIDIYVRFGEQWKVVSVQISKMP
jgi:ketosteroid isomerase-like protein